LPLGWFWFVGTLVPVIGFVHVGPQAYADRYTYVSYIGLFIMLAWGFPALLSKLSYRKIILGVSMAAVLTPLGICAHREVGYWKNSITIFSHATEVTQNNYFAYGNLGVAYVNLNRYTEAMEALSQAIRIQPDYAEGHYNLGLAYAALGRWSEAVDAYKQAIKIKSHSVESYINLGIAYGYLGRFPEAIDAFKQAIKFKPDHARAHYALGVAYVVIGDKNSALAEYNILKSLNPEMANNLLTQINK